MYKLTGDYEQDKSTLLIFLGNGLRNVLLARNATVEALGSYHSAFLRFKSRYESEIENDPTMPDLNKFLNLQEHPRDPESLNERVISERRYSLPRPY